MNCGKDALTVTPEVILENEVFAMSKENEIIGFYELKIDEKMAALEHFWINPEYIGSGIGRKLFAHALEKAVFFECRNIEYRIRPERRRVLRKNGAQKRIGDVVSENRRTRENSAFDANCFINFIGSKKLCQYKDLLISKNGLTNIVIC